MPRRPVPEWPRWMYGPNNEAQVFQTEHEVPYGWTRKPGEVFVPPPSPPTYDREALEKELREMGITPHPAWSARYMKEVIDNGCSPAR